METTLKMWKGGRLFWPKRIGITREYNVTKDCNIGTGQQPVWLHWYCLYEADKTHKNETPEAN